MPADVAPDGDLGCMFSRSCKVKYTHQYVLEHNYGTTFDIKGILTAFVVKGLILVSFPSFRNLI